MNVWHPLRNRVRCLHIIIVSAHAEPLYMQHLYDVIKKRSSKGWVGDTTYLRRLLDALFMTI